MFLMLLVGLLERPVIIESGKREKRKVERLEVSMNVTPKEKKFDIAEGSGEKLGDIPRGKGWRRLTDASEIIV